MNKQIAISFLTILIITLSLSGISQISCTHEISGDVIMIDGENYNPGDVICLLASNKDYLLLRNFQGTSSQPITIINKGGAIVIDTDHSYGIKLDNCKHVIFSGNGTEGIQYGIQVKRVANGGGMSIDNRSTNVEIEFVEVSFTFIAGIYAKTEPYQGDCSNLVTRDNFTMYDLKIHDCYIHHTSDEGFYIGSSKYTGQTVYQCNNVVVMPHLIEGVQIYNNIVENIGWDGIQVSSATDDCNIFNNLVRNDSYDEEPYQMSGILIGGGAKCDCYNNKIFDGKGDGIDVLGLGNMKIFNNLIVRAGRTFKPEDPTEVKHGIYVGQVVTNPGATFKLYNNTIISPKSSGVKYTNSEASMGYIVNNLISDPGEIIGGNPSYVNITVSQEKIVTSNNYNVLSNSTAKFLDYGNNNFDLKPNSGAVNYGTSLTNEGITFDIDNRARPFHTYFDAGAYECHDPGADIDELNNYIGNPFPIPSTDYINIPVSTGINNNFKVVLTSLSGNIVFNKAFDKSSIIEGNIRIDTKHLQTGKYILSIIANNNSISKPAIIVNQ